MLAECEESFLTNGRQCGTILSRFEERGYHCIVEILNCFPKHTFAEHAEASFLVAHGRLLNSPDNDTTVQVVLIIMVFSTVPNCFSSLRYFPLTGPDGAKLAVIPCTLDGIWEALSTAGERFEVSTVQCITSDVPSMNHISPFVNYLYRR
ncbi:unnamed protein product [Gongylonema pulchrum]|uniref:Uncharacterized protein n=1 Tax=Gongylonema pulchrum TaxID=637853 RepID=A0A3P6Q0B3_9BILA|nr:unnamed protein product [Gongylonema pulchrum]